MRLPPPDTGRWQTTTTTTSSRENIQDKSRHAWVHPAEEKRRGTPTKNTLGTFLVSNHEVIHQLQKFEGAARCTPPVPTVPTEASNSISSDADIERAEASYDGSAQHQESRGYEYSPTTPEWREKDMDDDERDMPSPGDWDDEQGTPRSGYDSAFDSTGGTKQRLMPNEQPSLHVPSFKALADEVTACSEYAFARRATKSGQGLMENGSSILSSVKKLPLSPKHASDRSIFDVVKANFFQKANICAPPITSILSDEEGRKVESSIWSYLDPNDDLRYYDYEEEEVMSKSSSERLQRRSERRRRSDPVTTSRTRSRSSNREKASPSDKRRASSQHRKASPPVHQSRDSPAPMKRASPSQNLKGGRNSREGRPKNERENRYTPSPVESSHYTASPVPEKDPMQEAYEDLMFLKLLDSSSPSNGKPALRESPKRKSSREYQTQKSREQQRDSPLVIQKEIAGHRDSPQSIIDSYSAFRRNQDQKQQSESPQTVWSDTSKNVRSSTPPMDDNPRLRRMQRLQQSRSSPSDFVAQVQSDPAPRVRISITSNPPPRPQEIKERQRSANNGSRGHVPRSADRDVSRLHDDRIQTDYSMEHDEVADAFNTEKETVLPRRSRSSDPKNRPRSSDPKTRSNKNSPRVLVTPIHLAKSPKHTPRSNATTPRRSNGNSSPRKEMSPGNGRSSRYTSDMWAANSIPFAQMPLATPFQTDFDMLAAMHLHTNAPIALPVIAAPTAIESKVSTLSGESSEYKRRQMQLTKQLNKVRCRSVKNATKLQGGIQTLTRSRIPDKLPGAADTESYSSSDSDSSEGPAAPKGFDAGYANCMNGGKQLVENDEDIYAFNSGSTESSGIGKHIGHPTEANRNAFAYDSEGHYMYVAYSRFGDDAREIIQLCEHASIPIPNSRGNEVLVQILASTISATDCEIRRGEWNEVRLDPYIIPGVGFVGRIHHTEKKSTFQSLQPGDMVMSLVKSGANSRYICIQRDQLVRIPDSVNPLAAVCLTETYLSAFQALHLGQRTGIRYRDNSLRGTSVLILGGSSCLGQALIELSLAGGADFVYATVRAKQFESITKLGAIPLSRDPQDWLTLIGHQIGRIISVKGGLYAEEVTREHMKALTADGQVIVIGEPGGENAINLTAPNPAKLMCTSNRNKLANRAQSFNVFDHWKSDQKQSKRDFSHLLELLQKHALNPQVLERIPLCKVPKAQSIVETKRLSGYILCEPWQKSKIRE